MNEERAAVQMNYTQALDRLVEFDKAMVAGAGSWQLVQAMDDEHVHLLFAAGTIVGKLLPMLVQALMAELITRGAEPGSFEFYPAPRRGK